MDAHDHDKHTKHTYVLFLKNIICLKYTKNVFILKNTKYNFIRFKKNVAFTVVGEGDVLFAERLCRR